MMSFEYKVVPAPQRGLKAKGVKTPQDRFALALEAAMNELAADGWEYLRADTLPSEQREGLMSKTTVYHNMLVFRRAKAVAAPVATPPTPQLEAPRPLVSAERVAPQKPVTAAPLTTGDTVEKPATAARDKGKKPDGPGDVAAE